MQYKDIEIFLELVNSRNITKASEHLFMAQSVISTRLKKLEEELGYDLFVRNKGMREIELTRQGADFVNLANRLRALYEEAALLRDTTRKTIRVAAAESIYFDILGPVLFNIMHKYPDISVNAEMVDSSVVYEMMESNSIDFGFASYESSHHNITHKYLYNQKFCLVMANAHDRPIVPSDLDPSKEIRFSGGNFSSIDLWREEHFPGANQGRVVVNSSLMLAKFLKEFDYWAILPQEEAEMLVDLYGISICELSDAPESRKIYFLTHSSQTFVPSEAAQIFIKELEKYESD